MKIKFAAAFLCLLFLMPLCFASLDVNIQDQTTRPFDFYFVDEVGAPTLVSQDVKMDQTWVVVDNIVSIVPGTYLGIFSISEEKFYFADVLSVSGTNLTLDTPFDFNFSAGHFVRPLTREMNVDGSTACRTFSINGPQTGAIDITRIIFYMITDTIPDLGKFGDITGGLTNGLVLRKTDGENWNINNVKNNGEWVGLQYDLTVFDASSPGQGVYGLAGRYTLNGPDKHGVPIRLSVNQSLDYIICDDLESIISFKAIGAGQAVDFTANDSVKIDGEGKMELIIFLIVLICLLLFGAFWALKQDNTEIFYTAFLFLGGVLFCINAGAFFVMEMSSSLAYYPVVRVIFIVISILSTIYLFVGMLPIILLMFWNWFKKLIGGDKK